MKYRALLILVLVLTAMAVVSPSWAITDVYVGVSDATNAGGIAGPAIVHYQYDPSGGYTFRGAVAIGAGNVASHIEVNSPGASGGIYAGITGSTNVLREYSFASSSFTSLRENSATIGDLAVDPNNGRLYGINSANGNLTNYVANGSSFTEFSQGVGAVGGKVHVVVDNNNNTVVVGGRDGTSSLVPITSFDFDGSTFTTKDVNGTDLSLTAMAVSPTDNTIWAANTVSSDPGAVDRMFQFALPADIPGGGAQCPGNPPPGSQICNVALGDMGSEQDPVFLPEITDLDVLGAGHAPGFGVGVSEDYTLFGDRGTWLLGWFANPHTIQAGGNGFLGLKIGSQLGSSGLPVALDIDADGTIHVLHNGRLESWEVTDSDSDPINGALFTAIHAVNGVFGDPQSIATALGVAPPGVTGDRDGDRDVDGADFLIYQRDDPSLISTEWEPNYSTGVGQVGAVTVVPEPGSALLALCGLLLVGGSRRRGYPEGKLLRIAAFETATD